MASRPIADTFCLERRSIASVNGSASPAPLALPHPDRSGALAELQVRQAQRRRLADAESGLEQELDHGVVAPRGRTRIPRRLARGHGPRALPAPGGVLVG